MLLIVAESTGSSPGRQGYKMAVGADGELAGSIGGGVMEVNLVEQARTSLSEPPAVSGGLTPSLTEQVHRRDVANSSGMICSGRQTVIFKILSANDREPIERAIGSLAENRGGLLTITSSGFRVGPPEGGTRSAQFEKTSDTEFVYQERLGFCNELYIVGGGHCALALSELMSKMDFYIRLFDDRPQLNTLDKNEFVHEKKIIESYEMIGDLIPAGQNVYVVVMTLGYRSDAVVIRQLVEMNFRYFGVLGSKAKMATLFKELIAEGIAKQRLDLIRTPIGLPINSHTPEEIAISIAAEIISVKNSAAGT